MSSSEAQGPAGLVGREVAGYRLERMLGKGVTGAVFLGQRLEGTPGVIERTERLPVEMPDEVAVKALILPWQLEEDERADFRARFVREAQTLQRLQHPHILSILDYGDDPATGATYMILPYMPGGTLASCQARLDGPAPLGEVADVLSQVAGALDILTVNGAQGPSTPYSTRLTTQYTSEYDSNVVVAITMSASGANAFNWVECDAC